MELKIEVATKNGKKVLISTVESGLAGVLNSISMLSPGATVVISSKTYQYEILFS